MLGPEGKHRTKLFARHSLTEGIKMHHGILLAKNVKGKRGL
jgi:hypothetical protein